MCFCDSTISTIDYLYCEGLDICLEYFFGKLILFVVPCLSGFNLLRLFLIPDFKGVDNLYYCIVSINNNLFVVKYYSSLVVSGLSRIEFNSYS